MNNNVKVLLEYLELAEVLGTEEITLKGHDIRLLNDLLRTSFEKNKQFSKMIINMTKELENLNI